MTKTKKIFAGAFAILFSLFIIFVVLLLYFGLLEYIVNSKLKSLVEGRFHATVEVGDISGDFLNYLDLKDIVIIYDDSANSYTMARIPNLYAEYDYTDMWKGQLNFKRVFIDSASLVLRKTDKGDWLIPQPLENGQEGGGFDFNLEEVGINGFHLEIQYPNDTLVFKDIMLKAHVSAVDNTYALDIDALSYHSSDERLSLASAGGKATLSHKNLLFQDIFLFTRESKIRLDGQAVLQKRPEIRMDIDAENISLPEVSNFVGADLRGNVAVHGKLSVLKGVISASLLIRGDFMDRAFDSLNTVFSYDNRRFTFDTLYGLILKSCNVHAGGALDIGAAPPEYYLTGSIKNLNLDNLVENTFHSDFNGDIELSGTGLRSRTLDIDIATDLDESWFDIYHATHAAGSLKVTTDSIIFKDNMRVSYYDNHFTADGKIEYSGNMDINGSGSLYDLSAFNDKIFISRLGGRATVEGSITGKTGNPDLQGQLLSDSLWLYDVYSSAANITGDIKQFTNSRSGSATALLLNGNAYSVPMDSAFMSMDIDSQNVRISDVDFYNDYAHLKAAGNLDYESYPQRLTFDNVDVDLFDLPLKNEQTVEISIDSTGFEFNKIRFVRPVGYIGWQGRINYDETIDLKFSGDNIKIRPWTNLLNKEYDVGGFLSGEATLKGPMDDPEMTFKGTIDTLSLEELYLGNLDADLRYRNRRVMIDSVYINSGSGEYFASGYYPIDLSFGEVTSRFPSEDMDVDISAHDDSLKLVGLLFKDVDQLTGDFQTSLRLSGTPLYPEFFGKAEIHNGRLKTYYLVNPFVDLNIMMRMNGRTIKIDSAKAVSYEEESGNSADNYSYSGTKGTVSLDGTVQINNIDSLYYNLSVDVNNLPAVYELGDISGVLNANLIVSGQSPPIVFGDVNIIKADYNENFAEGSEGWYVLSEIEAENSWDLNLNTEFASNVWVKNDDIDAEMSGTVNVIRENGRYRFIGEVEILRGKAFIAKGTRTIRFEPGGTIYYDDIEYPNPRLDIPATARIRKGVTDPATGEVNYESFDLALHIGGTLDEPLITAPEGSEYNTEDIATLLVTDYATGNQAGEGFRPGERLAAGAIDYFNAQATRLVSQLGVETLEIDPYITKQVTVGTYFNPNLYLYGRVGATQEAGQEVGFEYRLEKFMLLEGRVNEQNLYNLLLNFYWEY